MAAIWDSKQYNRINWQNRPSTATALGATNLNKIDVFCNNIDNAMIQMDAGKLNIETANSMLASVSFNSETGVFTFKELDGTTYTYDLNLEKIPVSFSLSEDGILTMTTEDGTQWTCNIGELIKDYVFDDSDTIAFEKEFVEEDDEGKGSYHVTASVKAGSINETHLDPDYRSDILAYKTQAQEAANDALTYSKDSKRWAVGDAEYEGSDVDNAKYYKEQAEAAKTAAEEAADRAAQVADVDIATTTTAGIVKPDGTTIGVEADGTIKSLIDATSLLITDNQELVVPKEGDVAQKTTTQLLVDAIANKVVNELVTNTSLLSTLANYVAKSQIVQVESTSQDTIPSSAYLKTVKDSLDEDISELNSGCFKFSGGEEIPNNADLDNYRENGNYYCSKTTSAQTLKNCPASEAFTMKVEKSTGNNYPCQTIREYTTGNLYYRFYDVGSNKWITWRICYETKAVSG